MKKTLAAVLAAAMALSTATVAFAKDTVYLEGDLENGSTIDSTGIKYGKEYKQYLSTDVLTRDELGEWLDDNIIKIDTIVTEGRSAFETVPTTSVKTIKTGETTQTTSYVWAKDISVFEKGEPVTKLPVKYYSDSKAWHLALDAEPEDYIISTDKDWNKVLKEALNLKDSSGNADPAIVAKKNSTTNVGEKAVQVKFKVRHTYGTGDTTVKMKFKITFKKDSPDGRYSKGDTYTTDEMELVAKYAEVNSYSKDMVLTLEEVKADNGNVILKGDKLYDEIGNDTFSIQFEDTAVFEAKAASSQKKVNLFYTLDEITEVTEAYPAVDFDFITFKGNPSFVNSGTMTFNAIGGKNTTVYTFDGETLTPLTSTYDSAYKTVAVKGIKKLGTFVVASEILEVEDEEDNEPVSSAPVVEEPSSQPSSSEDKNPSTGAC